MPPPSIPNTQADSGILLVLAQLVAGMLFFALGLDREVLRLFAQSLERIPAGGLCVQPCLRRRPSSGWQEACFPLGVRLALPVVALLVMVDVALALLGRLNAQLQLLSLAFPAKMLTALSVLAGWSALYPAHSARSSAGQAWRVARRVLGL